jgi:hypothetical protein
VAATRNALVHLPAAPEAVLKARDLVEAVDLVLVLHGNLLLDLGLAPERAGTLLRRSYGQQLFWQRLHQRDCAWPKRGSPSCR